MVNGTPKTTKKTLTTQLVFKSTYVLRRVERVTRNNKRRQIAIMKIILRKYVVVLQKGNQIKWNARMEYYSFPYYTKDGKTTTTTTTRTHRKMLTMEKPFMLLEVNMNGWMLGEVVFPPQPIHKHSSYVNYQIFIK